MDTEKIRLYFEQDLYAQRSGIDLLELREGYAKAAMKVEPYHLNAVGTVQGGAIFTLADLAFAAACNSHGTVAVAINVNISFVKAATRGTLVAEAKEVSRNPKLGSYTIHVTDDAGEIVAVFQGLAYRKKDSLDLGNVES